MAQGNKGFASLMTGGNEVTAEVRRPPKSGFLGSRDNRLSALASGGLITRVHEAVDPAMCRIWQGHNRDYAALNETVCADLISSLRAQGRQEIPAIVRRVTDDSIHQFEVICGARRHWSVTWLRAHDYPDFKFVVEPRELTDEEAFRIADLENRSRKDLSDYERAIDYARAVERYYEGNQQRMATRLEVTKSWLSRYLELARLPGEILACFSSPHVIGISHAAVIAPLLNRPPPARKRLLDAATVIAREQQANRVVGTAPLTPAAVVARLNRAIENRPKPARSDEQIRTASGVVILKVRREGRGVVVFTVPAALTADRDAVCAAVDDYLKKLAPDR
jgi:ParB family transcriptional regulator, chromosome partitioning protein